MKVFLSITALLLTLFVQAQKTDSLHWEEYTKLISYTPKAYCDTLNKPSALKDIKNLGTIFYLSTAYGYAKNLGFTQDDIKWLEGQVNQLALAFYLEGKPVMLREVGGYDGCPDIWFYPELQNGKEVTIITLCYSCTEAKTEHRDFIKIFNRRTTLLLAATQ
ncbi:hypothetical protein AM493_13380 [Flavobacterium akiainvivens]|uniref:Uncharacterized protein n=1 Tax=Flavobacterium akiainvivens TaxID=1202724 RepID=A0A0M8MIH0_9FLAO|nr:hypothetical protein [Flavobacterium akiainvivens]KOS06911.1 hypothetical protein AM493_13380 [Flavobacterium akiainvivens]SFQ69762.1 hypothetical protein SAMN05444144_11569 [Flavobacterium akiainvivens]